MLRYSVNNKRKEKAWNIVLLVKLQKLIILLM